MDGFTIRCNNLRCRTPLETRAVVTTCSHVFCEQCADALHLANPPPNHPRSCPACEGLLSNPDDAVIAVLNPTEDYKTSLLSGLSPSIIMEICSRGLAFWNYQVTQEAVYQEHRAKLVSDKYDYLSGEFDKVINDANTEVARLRNRVATLETGEEELKRKNHEMMEQWRDKSKKLAQMQDLYDKLKRKTLISGVREAAAENVEHALNTPRMRNVRAYPGPGSAQPPLPGDTNMFQAGGAPVFHASNAPQIPSVRRQRGAEDDDVYMTGARIGVVGGVPRSESGSINSDEMTAARQRGRAGVNAGRQRTSSYRMDSAGGFSFGAPPSSQEHRQRLPPTPLAQGGGGVVYGQNPMPFGGGVARNPLGQVPSNIGLSTGRQRKR